MDMPKNWHWHGYLLDIQSTTSEVTRVKLQRESPKLCIRHNSARNLCMLAI